MTDLAYEADPEIIRLWQANLQAEKLRRLGLSYESVRIVMLEYHSVDRSMEQWRSQLRQQGCGPHDRGHGRHPVAA